MSFSGNNDRCGKCRYGINWGNGWYCNYLEVTGHRRPYKFAECKLYLQKHEAKMHRYHEQFMELYKNGLNDSEISRKMDVSANMVFRWRSGLGLKSNFNKNK